MKYYLLIFISYPFAIAFRFANKYIKQIANGTIRTKDFRHAIDVSDIMSVDFMINTPKILVRKPDRPA